MELRHLRYFVAVAEEQHVTRAAARLGLQQPPLSQQIRALEAELGVQLLRRHPRGVEATSAGDVFLQEARTILHAIDHAVARTQRTARGEEGRCAVGFTSSAPFHPSVTSIIREFREQHPRVSLTLEEGGTGDLEVALRNSRLDLAFIRSPIAASAGVEVEWLLDEPMLVALPVHHPLARVRTPLALEALAAEPFVLYRRASGPGLHDAIIAACHQAGFSPRTEQEAPRIVATLNLVAAGLGVTVVPRSLSETQQAQIAYRRLKASPGLVAPIWLAHRGDGNSPSTQRFVELVRSRVGAREQSTGRRQ